MFLRKAVLIVAVVGSALTQEQCASSCAPQPIVIELSCNGNNGAPPPPAPAPPHFPPAGGHAPAPAPAPAPYSEEPHYPEPETTTDTLYSYDHNVLNDPDRHNKCLWKNNGYGTFFLNGNTSNKVYLSDFEGLYTTHTEPDPYDRIRWFRDDIQKPPRNWDGSEENLGFKLPERGTPEYDFYLCWPLLEKTYPDSPHFNIKDDPDRHDNRNSCNWFGAQYDGFDVNHGSAKGGFPSVYKMHRYYDPMTVEIETAPDTPRPAQDWDGAQETLGFPLPEKNTPLYNMLMCWPYDFRM